MLRGVRRYNRLQIDVVKMAHLQLGGVTERETARQLDALGGASELRRHVLALDQRGFVQFRLGGELMKTCSVVV